MKTYDEEMQEVLADFRAHRGSSSEIMKKLRDVSPYIKWRQFAIDYFDKSVPWFYNKLHERDGHGGTPKFTEEEILILKGGLIDLADRFRKTADQLM